MHLILKELKPTSNYLKAIEYPGSKLMLLPRLLQLIPKHDVYIEPFGGGAVLLLNKPQVRCEIYNDLDDRIYTYFKVIHDRQLFQELLRKLQMPFKHEKLYLHCADMLFDNDKWNSADIVDRAFAVFVFCTSTLRLAFHPSKVYFDIPNDTSHGRIPESYVAMLPAVHKRLYHVVFCKRDALHLIKQKISTSTEEIILFYLDPPYASENTDRSLETMYGAEMTTSELHKKMVDLLLSARPNHKFLMTIYWHEVYQPLIDEGWHRIDIEHFAHSPHKNSSRRKRIETILLNYEPPKQLKLF